MRIPRMSGRRAQRYGRHKAIAVLVTFGVVWVYLQFFLPDRTVLEKLERWANPQPGPAEAFRDRLSEVVVEAPVVVEKVLADSVVWIGDRGVRQRLTVRTLDGHPLKILHDPAAARLAVAEGDTLVVRGLYTWDPRGGTLRSPPPPSD